MKNIAKVILATILRTTNPVQTGALDSSDAVTVSGSGLVYFELRPDLDRCTIIGQGKPTFVTQGIFEGFSLPIYAADNEELFLSTCAPGRYDGASDIEVHVYCWLSLAEDTKNFKLQLTWEHCTPGTDTVPATSNDVEVQTATGAGAAQFQSYEVSFTIDYDIDTPDDIIADDIIAMRLRRIAATANDCAGEIVISHLGIVFRRNKLGTASP